MRVRQAFFRQKSYHGFLRFIKIVLLVEMVVVALIVLLVDLSIARAKGGAKSAQAELRILAQTLQHPHLLQLLHLLAKFKLNKTRSLPKVTSKCYAANMLYNYFRFLNFNVISMRVYSPDSGW